MKPCRKQLLSEAKQPWDEAFESGIAEK